MKCIRCKAKEAKIHYHIHTKARGKESVDMCVDCWANFGLKQLYEGNVSVEELRRYAQFKEQHFP